ncbi:MULTISPECIES: DUF4232 domain-containing protein [Actinomadura]|uniref:DUF4232 domain-containing protein n=1 Tax=Actinomadura yumaensis TaxID=111807 RepID=A0ABW2CNJ7_9ACTN|nr:DUF4232 domain-containing protein [Actinomadura sp. J1-007]MWK36896.1 DUF4232 domain-containing protein [Actinomadura sp. J1-007]
MNTRRLLNVIGAGVAAGVLSGGLAACGSDTPTPVKGAAAPAPGGSSPAGSESPGGGESGTPGTGSKPGAASPGGTAGAGRPTRTGSSTDRCHSSQLRASIGRGSPGAGQRNFPLVLTNISSQTCTLHGFPGAGFFAAEGGQIGADPVRTGGAGSLFRLAPGRSAWAGLSFPSPDITGANAVQPATVVVTPPDERDSISARWTGGKVPASGTSSSIKITSLSPGTGA